MVVEILVSHRDEEWTNLFNVLSELKCFRPWILFLSTFLTIQDVSDMIAEFQHEILPVDRIHDTCKRHRVIDKWCLKLTVLLLTLEMVKEILVVVYEWLDVLFVGQEDQSKCLWMYRRLCYHLWFNPITIFKLNWISVSQRSEMDVRETPKFFSYDWKKLWRCVGRDTYVREAFVFVLWVNSSNWVDCHFVIFVCTSLIFFYERQEVDFRGLIWLSRVDYCCLFWFLLIRVNLVCHRNVKIMRELVHLNVLFVVPNERLWEIECLVKSLGTYNFNLVQF